MGVAAPRPLAELDDRSTFDCGRESINAWFRRRAWQNQLMNVSRTSVICDVSSGRIAGFVALSSGQIEREFLPKSYRRNKPDPVPVVLLGQLGVANEYQGQGYGHSLLRFAINIALESSRHFGSFGVITHPIDEAARRFYERAGFQDLPFDPRRAMIVRMVDLERTLAT
ncbi:MAG: GNAT family N-acetyltransferase [Deltaproteobacteria bacterium]|nr:GNAT family N-acetyltransferase [Deltaproteobacteria bacterium]